MSGGSWSSSASARRAASDGSGNSAWRSCSTAWSSSSRTRSRVPSRPAPLAQVPAPVAGLAEQVAQAPGAGHALAQQVAEGVGGPVPGQDPLPQPVQRPGHVERRLQRVGPAPPGAVAVAHPAAVDRAARQLLLGQALGQVEALHGELEGGRGQAGRLGPVVVAEAAQELGQPRHRPDPGQQLARRDQVAGLDGGALVEAAQQPRQVGPGQPGPPGLGHRPAQQVLEQLQLPALLQLVELDLAEGDRDDRRQVDHPGHRHLLAADGGPAHGRGPHGLGGGDGEAGRDAGAGVDLGRLAHRPGEAGDDLEQVAGDQRPAERLLVPGQHRLLADQGHLVVQAQRVVGADLGPEAVLERGDDAAPVGVVLGVGAGDQEQVQGQPQLVAADLDVALLEHVEQRHLDPLGQVGQLVDAEDAPVGAGHQPVVDGLGVAEGAALGHLDGVDVADQVADAGVGGGQLLAVALGAVPPGHRQLVAQLVQPPPAGDAGGHVRVVVDLAAGDHRGPLVQQVVQRPDQAGLALPALAQEHDVVARRAGPAPARGGRCRRSRRSRGSAPPRRPAGARRLSRSSCLTAL